MSGRAGPARRAHRHVDGRVLERHRPDHRRSGPELTVSSPDGKIRLFDGLSLLLRMDRTGPNAPTLTVDGSPQAQWRDANGSPLADGALQRDSLQRVVYDASRGIWLGTQLGGPARPASRRISPARWRNAAPTTPSRRARRSWPSRTCDRPGMDPLHQALEHVRRLVVRSLDQGIAGPDDGGGAGCRRRCRGAEGARRTAGCRGSAAGLRRRSSGRGRRRLSRCGGQQAGAAASSASRLPPRRSRPPTSRPWWARSPTTWAPWTSPRWVHEFRFREPLRWPVNLSASCADRGAVRRLYRRGRRARLRHRHQNAPGL